MGNTSLFTLVLFLVGVAALFTSPASGTMQVAQTASTNTSTSGTPMISVTTVATSITIMAQTVNTVLSWSVYTVSAVFQYSTVTTLTQTFYTSAIATVTNIVPVLTAVSYPVVSVFVTVSEFIPTAPSAWIYFRFYGWILLALGLALFAVLVAVLPLVRRKARSS